jgi:hypothetical protein
MRTPSVDPDGSPDFLADATALLSALRLAGWMGVGMTLQDCNGNGYRIKAPIIIGDNFVQFATGTGLQQVRVPFNQIAAFELL